MGVCNCCEGDTWLVDTLYWCQSLRGKPLTESQARFLLSVLLFCFLLSLHLSLLLSLIFHFVLPLHLPLSLSWSGNIPYGNDSEPLLTSGAGCSFTQIFLIVTLLRVHTRVGPLEHPSGRLPLLLHDIPRWPSVSSAECKHFLVKSDCYQEGAESLLISRTEEWFPGAHLDCDSVYAPCSLLECEENLASHRWGQLSRLVLKAYGQWISFGKSSPVSKAWATALASSFTYPGGTQSPLECTCHPRLPPLPMCS